MLVLYVQPRVARITAVEDPALANAQDVNMETTVRDRIEWSVGVVQRPAPIPAGAAELAEITRSAGAAPIVTDRRRRRLSLAASVDRLVAVEARLDSLEDGLKQTQVAVALGAPGHRAAVLGRGDGDLRRRRRLRGAGDDHDHGHRPRRPPGSGRDRVGLQRLGLGQPAGRRNRRRGPDAGRDHGRVRADPSDRGRHRRAGARRAPDPAVAGHRQRHRRLLRPALHAPGDRGALALPAARHAGRPGRGRADGARSWPARPRAWRP